MKTYKLIKKYPGCPDLGYITKPKCDDEKDCYYWMGNWFNPQDFPEFWQEVKEEKEYEILSFKEYYSGEPDKPTGFIYPICGDKIGPFSNAMTVNEWLNNDKQKSLYRIHSIRRNSDGEVFTVGDRIQHTRGPSPIESIDVREDWIGGLRIMCKDREGNSLSTLRHVKTPLFITEDNVPIYEGDEYWYYHADGNSGIIYSANAGCAQANGVKRFSTKQAAEDYIAKNKVLFITEDGVGIKKLDKFYVVNTLNYTWWEGNFVSLQTYGENYLKFSSSSKAQEYIDENKPMYSRKQIKKVWDSSGWMPHLFEQLIKDMLK